MSTTDDQTTGAHVPEDALTASQRTGWRHWMSMRVVLRSILSVVLISGAVALFVALGTSKPPQPRSDTTWGDPIVDTADVSLHDGGIVIEADGVVVPLREINIAAQVQGRVQFKAKGCRIGRYVKQGDLLIRIDPRDYEIEIDRLEQDLEQAEGSLEELDADLLSNHNEVALDRDEVAIRKRELLRYEETDDPGVFAMTELDTAKRNELLARTGLQASLDKSKTLAAKRRRLEGARNTVKSRLEKARLDLTRTEIRAPINGIIILEQVEQNGYAQTGMTLIAIQDTENIEVKCSLHAHQEQWLWLASQRSVSPRVASQSSETASLGETQLRDNTYADEYSTAHAYEIPPVPATVCYANGPSACVWQGTLNRYDGAGFDEQTRMVPVRVRVEDPLSGSVSGGPEQDDSFVARRALKKGMFVKVKIRISPQTNLVRLPQAAVRPGNVVWTVHEGELQRVEVKPVHAAEGQVLLFQDQTNLRPGTQVVVSPLPSPANGQRVVIAERLVR